MILINNFLARAVEADNEIVCGILIGIICVCLLIFGIFITKLFDQENKIADNVKRREKINKIKKRN